MTKECPQCNGSGTQGRDNVTTCFKCNGTGKVNGTLSELDKLRADNALLRLEVEKAKQERNAEGVKQRNIYLPQLKAHRDALIEAGKALEYCKDFVFCKPYGTLFKLHIPKSALAAISELLQKESK